VQDVVFTEYPQTQQVNLDGVVTDPDDPDENIVYTIVSNSNPSALTATMSGKILVMTRQNANQATANLTMRATSDGQHVDFNVQVILNAVVDEPPYIVNPVQDVVFNEYPQTQQVNLDGVATDPDDPDESITYSIVSNSNPSSLTATMSGKILIMTRQNEYQATADLTMRATSDGQHVDFNVHVIINGVNDEPPYIANPLQDVIFTDFPQTIEIDLVGVASDPDDPNEDIVYSVVSNPFPEDVTATLDGKILVLTRGANNDADFSVVMRATSDGQYVDFSVHILMYIVEDVEEISHAMTVYPNPTQGMITIDLSEGQSIEYEVYDLVGQNVLRGRSNDGSARIDLTSCRQGIYFIAVVWGENRLIQKVIVR
jgi:putative lipoic acid-binding regulatory protein